MKAIPIIKLTALVAFSVGATAPVSAAQQSGKSANDYWAEVVCKKEEVVGSRLATRRTCLTRLQWAERAREERDSLIQSQTKGACLGGTSASGKAPTSC